jgi:hypothetical protein
MCLTSNRGFYNKVITSLTLQSDNNFNWKNPIEYIITKLNKLFMLCHEESHITYGNRPFKFT